MWRGDLAPLRAAVSELAPGSAAYVGNARRIWGMHWLARDYAAASALAAASDSDGWSDQSNIVLPRRLYLAWAYRAAGKQRRPRPRRLAAVLESTRAALGQRADDAELHLALGLAEAERGRKDDALREGRRAVRLDAGRAATQLTGSGMLVWAGHARSARRRERRRVRPSASGTRAAERHDDFLCLAQARPGLGSDPQRSALRATADSWAKGPSRSQPSPDRGRGIRLHRRRPGESNARLAVTEQRS